MLFPEPTSTSKQFFYFKKSFLLSWWRKAVELLKYL